MWFCQVSKQRLLVVSNSFDLLEIWNDRNNRSNIIVQRLHSTVKKETFLMDNRR